jgi:serpin B
MNHLLRDSGPGCRRILPVALALALTLAHGSCAPTPANPDAQLLARDGRRFAVDLYAQLAPSPGNVFFSPWSVRTALGMVYAGARDRTEQQMAAALHDSLGEARFHPAASWLDRELQRAGGTRTPHAELLTAHAIWVARGMRLERDFTKMLTTEYAARPRQIDFANGTAAAAAINDWVEKQTHARIHELIPSGALSRATRLVLCDAIYFRGAWRDSFFNRETLQRSFNLLDGRSVPLWFMHTHQVFRYAENESLQMLELPYRGGKQVMFVILPRAVDGLASLERQLDPESLAVWDSRMAEVKVMVALPKFRIEGEFRLAVPLAAMGMHDAFTNEADFSGIAREGPIFLSEVYHKAFVAVDDQGTEAAAATAVPPTLCSVPWSELPVSFTADHPFLFLIRDRPSGAILFMGRLADPR